MSGASTELPSLFVLISQAAACFRAQWTVHVQSVLSSVCWCFLCVKEHAVNGREDWGEKISGAIGNHGVTHLLT